MLERLQELVSHGESFAFETTLSTKSYRGFIDRVMELGYETILLFLTLDSIELAKQRVQTRVQEGGHNIPIQTRERRYSSGLVNFFKIYKSIVSRWIVVDNSSESFEFIAEGSGSDLIVRSKKLWSQLNEKYNGN
ncbi:zeta toxin family protein [Reichenbachiella faecimaris]|uniref:zeta toxin family protein n=1 Tax=Reichenbachiella faecimaris TaxID=692418 RepID=UPI001FE95343|nr:zeta toxin family protein [Reichenbachiella faecimaris]